MALVCLGLGFARSDCSRAAVGKPAVELTFWNGFTGPDGRAMLGMIRQFTQANPGIHVTMQRMDWATYYNKLMVAGLDGHGPELFVVHASTLARMNRAGVLAPLNEVYDCPGGIPSNDYDPYVLNQVRFGPTMVGVPLDIHPQGLYCNRALLKKAGLTHPPTDKEEFLRAAKAMQEDTDRDGHPEVWGYALTNWRMNFQSLIPQFGGHYFDSQGRADLANPGNVAALSFLASLGKDHLVPPPENGLGWVGYRQGKVAMVIDGVFMLGDLQRLDNLDYEGAPVPQIGPKPGTLADSHVLCVRNGITEKQKKAAERFIRFLSENSIEWAAAGQVPARRSIRATDAFKKMPVQSAFARQIPSMMYPPRTPVLLEMQLELDLAVEKVMRGRAIPKEALTAADANVQRFLDRDAQETGK